MSKFVALFKRVSRHDRYREVGIVDADDPLTAEQETVSRLDDAQQRAWFDSRIIIKLYNLETQFNERYDIIHQEDLDNLRNEMEECRLEEMEEPEGGWSRNSQADRM